MVPKESMDVTSNKSFIRVFHRAAKYSLRHDKSEFTNRNKKKCAQPKKPTTHTHQKKNKPKTFDCQTSRCSFKNKSSSLTGIAPTTITICLFNILAENELHEALLTPRN